MDIYFVKDKAQLDWLKGRIDLMSGAFAVIPLMPKAALELVEMGIQDVKLPIGYISRTERNGIRQKAIDLSRHWHLGLGLEIKYKGIDLIECCRLQMLGFFQDVLAAELIYPRIIEQYKPNNAYFMTTPEVPSCGQAMHGGTADVIEAVLQWRMKHKGIHVEIIRRAPFMRRVRHARRLFLPAGRRLRSLWSERMGRAGGATSDTRRLRASDVPKDKTLFVGFASGYDVSIIWPYLRALAEAAGGYPLIVSGSSVLAPTSSRSGLASCDDLRYLFINNIPLAEDDKVTLSATWRACWKSSEARRKIPEPLQNPLLRFQFEHLFDYLLPQALDSARRAVSFFSDHEVSLYLDDYCSGHMNRAWIEAGNMAGIQTVMVPHGGGINLVEIHDFNSKWAFAWGELGLRNWALASPQKSSCIVVSGEPSMESLRKRNWFSPDQERKSVLLITGGFLHQAWTDMDLKGFISTWNDIERIAIERPQVKFVIKPHPSVRDLGDWYKEFVRKRSIRNIKVIDDKTLEDLLTSTFFAVLLGKPGTAGLIAALASVPFIYYDSMLCREVAGYQIWHDENGVPKLSHPAKLADIIDKIRLDYNERDRMLEKNRKFLNLFWRPFQAAKTCKQIGLGNNAPKTRY